MTTKERVTRFWLVAIDKDGTIQPADRGVYGPSKNACEAIRSAIWRLESSATVSRVCVFAADEDRKYRPIASLTRIKGDFGFFPCVITDPRLLEGVELLEDIAYDLNTGCQNCGAKQCQ
jgi:hypothetical protein